MNLKPTMELAGRNLLQCLCPTRNYLPYWSLTADREYRAQVSFSSPGHNIGRWWDAMLRLEDAIGYAIPAHLEGAMLQNLYRFFDNPDHLCFAPLDWEGVKPEFDLHSLREGLLALNALVRYRNSRWAAKEGHRMLETLLRISRPDGSWDLEKIDYYHRTEKPHRPLIPANTNGRLIEALVWFYEATGDPLALKLADRFACYHLVNTTHEDGRLNMASKPDHTHSYLGTLRGLLLFGELTGQQKYIDVVAATYQVTVRRMIKQSGFVSHDLGQDNRGETTSPGDAAQRALWLARRGYTEFLDAAERIIRARLIPAQITESPGLQPLMEDEGKEEFVNLDERIIGAIGGMHREPHAGKNSVTDITAACLHTLVDIYRHIVVRTNAGLTINFHFDYKDEQTAMTCERQDEARVTVVAKVRDNILIRIPAWTPRDSVQVVVNGRSVTPEMIGHFAHVSRDMLPGEIVLRYGLPVFMTVEETDGVAYELAWRGDEITGISPNSDFFPFYPTAK